MPFGQAKQNVETKVAPVVKEKGSVLLKAAYSNLLEKFDSHTKKANEYIAYANYPGHEKDRQDYLAQIRNSTDGYLKKKGAYDEFLKYSVSTDIRSDDLQNTIKEGIKKHEKEKYQKEKIKNVQLIREGNLGQAIKNLRDFQSKLSPLNRVGADKDGIKANLGEPSLELELVIKKRIGELNNEKKIFDTYMQPGITLDKNGAYKTGFYIHKVDNKGDVHFSGYEFKNKKDKDGSPIVGGRYLDYPNPQKMNWQEFYNKIVTKHDVIRKFNHEEWVQEDVKEPKEDKEVTETSDQISEIQFLKEVNFIYSGKLEAQIKDPEKKKAFRAALEENYNKLRLFFEKDSNGIIRPTEVYRKCSQKRKTRMMLALKNGFKTLIERNLLKNSIEDEKDPKMKLFLEGELAFRNQSYMSAYGKIRKFVNENSNDPKYKNEVAIAKIRLRKCSNYVLQFGYRSMMAYFQQRQGNEGNSMSKGYAEEMMKRTGDLVAKLNALILSGKAVDLHDALRQNPPNIAIFKKSLARDLGFTTNNWDTYFKKIADIAAKTDREDQKDSILDLGDEAREDGWTGAASSYYREYMQDGLVKAQKESDKSAEKWKAMRKDFLSRTKDKALKNDGSVGLFEAELSKFKIKDNKEDAIKAAYKVVGGEKKFKKLSKDKQEMIIRDIRAEIAFNSVWQSDGQDNFNSYVKKNKGGKEGLWDSVKSTLTGKKYAIGADMAAYDYNDMMDPNNESFNLSDATVQQLKKMAEELPIDVAIMAGSALVGAGAAGAVRSLRYINMINKMLKASKAVRYTLGGTAIAMDMAVSEGADRLFRKFVLGENTPFKLSSFLAHSIGMYGGMKYVASGGQRLLRPALGGKGASVFSLLGIEAPFSMAITNIMGEDQGSLSEQYGYAAFNMLKGRMSMGLMHKATGGRIMKQEEKYYEDMKGYKEGMKYLTKEQKSIKKILQDVNVKEEFVTLMTKFKGNYKAFLENNPKLAKVPEALLRLRFIPVPEIGLALGLPLKLKSIDDFHIKQATKSTIQEKTKLAETLKKAGFKEEAFNDNISDISRDLSQIGNLEGVNLGNFVKNFNKQNPNKFPDKAFRIIKKTSDGKIVAVNGKGELEVFKSKDYMKMSSQHRLNLYIKVKFDSPNFKTLPVDKQAEIIEKYRKSVEFISSKEVQTKLYEVIESLDGVSYKEKQALLKHIEENALEQHKDNQEKYVSHGFDHSLNVLNYANGVMQSSPEIVNVLQSKYNINQKEAVLLGRLIAIYHDFGYPEVGARDLGKALHGLTGAQIASSKEFYNILKGIIKSPKADVNKIMTDLKNSILYHSADKVEATFEAKVHIANATFLVNTGNIKEAIRIAVDKHNPGDPIEVVCSKQLQAKIEGILKNTDYMTKYKIIFRQTRSESNLNEEGLFRGRFMDLKKEKDNLIGLQFKIADMNQEPLNFLIRLADNLDMQTTRFSELQRTTAFKEIYHAFGPTTKTGKILVRLEAHSKALKKNPNQELDPKLKKRLEKNGIKTNQDFENIVQEYKNKLMDEILAKHPGDAKKFPNLRQIGEDQNSQSVRHFGGCEAVKGVKFEGGRGTLTITVDRGKFEALNKTLVKDKSIDTNGKEVGVIVGIGEYQIWRGYDAYKSLISADGKPIKIEVRDENGNTLIKNYSEYFKKEQTKREKELKRRAA